MEISVSASGNICGTFINRPNDIELAMKTKSCASQHFKGTMMT
jgi:hypothetical protein